MRSWTLGRILDYCIETINARKEAQEPERPTIRKATQADINAWLGPPKRKK